MKPTAGALVVLALVGACAEDAPRYLQSPDVSASVGEGGGAGDSASAPSRPSSAGEAAEAGRSGSDGGAGGAPAEGPADWGAAGDGSSPAGGAGGEEVACDTDDDCPERVCAVAECRFGRCDYELTGVGEACGDDGERFCAGSGACVECLGDLDCEANGPCSIGNCTAGGVCEQRPVERGQSCDDGTFCNGSETCDGEGACRAGNEPCPPPTKCDDDGEQCAGCINDADCPAEAPTCSANRLCICTEDEDCEIADECRVGRCELATGKCRIDDVDAETPVGTQLSGDCQKRQCNGDGAAVLVDDDDDLPADPGAPCVHPVCQSGEVVVVPRAPGTECGAAATECSGADTCDSAGVCQPNHQGQGTVLRAETQSECRRRTCDGAGNAVETPVTAACDDGSFCTGTESCSSGGTCQSSGDPCAGTSKPYCVGSVCQECSMDSQCDGLGSRVGHCIGVCVECTDQTLQADCGGPPEDVGCTGGRCYVKCSCSIESCGRRYSELCTRG